jgi:hypothetical protein
MTTATKASAYSGLDGRVYGRDASAYDRPNVRSPKQMHWPAADGSGHAACDRRIVLAIGPHGFGMKPSDVPLHRRCARNGCWSRWVS